MNLCKCGCGKEVTKESNSYISGHNTRGLKRDASSALKRKQTCMNRYGVISVTQLDSMKEKSKKTCIEKYGSDYITQTIQFKDRSKKSCIKRYGVESFNQSDIIKEKKKESYREHYGVDHPSQATEVKEKKKQTCLINFGVEYPGQSNIVKNKNKITCLKKYGVENPSQSFKIHNRKIKNSFRRKKYILPNGKEISIQGEEPQFLDYIFSNDLLKEEEIVSYPKRIKYITEDGKDHYYFPDFYVPKFNLIVEVKSSYILSLNPIQSDLKIVATKELGHNFIMILDKKYEEFKILVSQFSEQKLNTGVN